MRLSSLLAAVAVLAVAPGCGEGEGDCAAYGLAAFSVDLSVADGPLPASLSIALYGNGELLWASFTLEQIDGIYCTLGGSGDAGTGEAPEHVFCAWGAAGSGRLHATATGYQPVELALSAELGPDGCHPVPVSAEVVMQPR